LSPFFAHGAVNSFPGDLGRWNFRLRLQSPQADNLQPRKKRRIAFISCRCK
jgi:hypothetical protein